MAISMVALTRGSPATPLVLAVALAGSACTTGAQEAGGLDLEERYAYAVPDTFPVTGVAAGKGGDLVVWSAARPYLLRIADGQFTPLAAPGLARPAAAGFAADGSLEVLDGPSRTLVRFARDGVDAAPLGGELPARIDAAARASGGWYLASRDTTGVVTVAFVPYGSAGRVVFTSAAPAAERRNRPAYLSALGERAALVDAATDQVHVIGPDGAVHGRFAVASPPPPRAAGADDPLPDFLALPLVPLGAYLLQTLSDVRSDQRVLVLYDTRGTPVRTRELAVPLGFAASAPDAQEVVAVRRLGTQEIVGYRWRWREGSTHNTGEERP